MCKVKRLHKTESRKYMNARKILCLMAALLMLSGCSKGVDGSQASSKAAESSGKADSSVSDYDNTTTEPETDKHNGRLYKYSEAQDPRSAVDPRAQNEDLGDDPVRSSELGIANLKRIVPEIIKSSSRD
jgi:hypothetical protein